VKVFAVNISKQLEAYEVEYHVLQEEMNTLRAMSERKGSGELGGSSSRTTDSSGMPDRLLRLQIANDALRRQKIELLEQLQVLNYIIMLFFITYGYIFEADTERNLSLSTLPTTAASFSFALSGVRG